MSIFKRNKKPKFYSLDRILKTNAIYYVIFGERSNGKTYAVLTHALEQYFKTKTTFAYVRRWQEDIRGMRASSVFSALNADGVVTRLSGGEYEAVHYQAGKFYLCNYDETGKAIYNQDDLLGYTFALTDSEHNKSISYPDVTTILFDEFLTKGAYLPDEFVLFMNTISTIVRQRSNVKIFMLGNTVNKYCPYFEEMGLKHITKMEQGTIDTYKYGNSDLSVAVEYCESMTDSKESNFYFAFDNPKLHMITSGAWELDIYPHLPTKYKPEDVQFVFFIEFDGEVYQAEIIYKDDMVFIYIHEKTTPIKDRDNDLIYTLDFIPKMNYNRSIMKPNNQVQNMIKQLFVSERVFYQNNDVGHAIENYMLESNRR